MDISNEGLKITVGEASMGAYLVRPADAEDYPGIVLFMEVFGINEHIRSVADRVAAEGYVVLAPDIFHRTAPGIELGYDEAGLGRGVELMGQVTATELLTDIGARGLGRQARCQRGRGRRHGLLLRRARGLSSLLRVSDSGYC